MAAAIQVPATVQALLDALWSHGHAAYVVGGSIRDAMIGRQAADWDLTTDARPKRLLEIFPDAVYENRFGTVAVRSGDDVHEITTFRTDHDYADFRRPHRVEFGDDVLLDLARRDFTMNAMALGADAPLAGGSAPTPHLVDPYDGAADVAARSIRAVGDPAARFEEDALRMVRAVRLAAALDFEIEPATRSAIEAHADLVRHLSGERIAAELELLLAAPEPSTGLRLMADTGILAVVSADLAAQRGIAQNKIPGEDLLDHTLRTVDAAPAGSPRVRLAALVHDIGKPATIDDGPFRRHDMVGADLTAELLDRLHLPRATTDRVVRLVRHHMFTYDSAWGDSGVRRFIQRIGAAELDELFELRAADNVGSGVPANAHGLDELRERVRAQLEASVPLDLRQLAIDGEDLMSELAIPQGPTLGRILDALLERVVTDPGLNDRATLLLLAESILAGDR
jgi:tRNA nucleotidyltransferase (CCA-adding enzyme)